MAPAVKCIQRIQDQILSGFIICVLRTQIAEERFENLNNLLPAVSSPGEFHDNGSQGRTRRRLP